jgi:hypothetical protein
MPTFAARDALAAQPAFHARTRMAMMDAAYDALATAVASGEVPLKQQLARMEFALLVIRDPDRWMITFAQAIFAAATDAMLEGIDVGAAAGDVKLRTAVGLVFDSFAGVGVVAVTVAIAALP